MFKTKREFAQALLDGRRFASKNGTLFYFDEKKGFRVHFPDGEDRDLVGWWNHFIQPLTEIVPWESTIPPEGYLCWVSDTNKSPNNNNPVKIIIRFDPDRNRPYRTPGVAGYLYATPLTLAEAQARIYNPNPK